MASAHQGRPVLVPGPSHPITIEPNPAQVLVWVGGRVVADTTAALTLREAGYAAVEYVPAEDVDFSMLVASDHVSYCPYKGDCSYYSVIGVPDAANAVWEYKDPSPAVAQIKGHVAFYPDRVERIEQRPR